MKIKLKDDFQKIIDNLPPQTGCRWFVRDSNPRDQPSYFNKGFVEEVQLLDSTASYHTPSSTPARARGVRNNGIDFNLHRAGSSIFSPARSPSHVAENSEKKTSDQLQPNVITNNRFDALTEDSLDSDSESHETMRSSPVITSSSSAPTQPTFAVGQALSEIGERMSMGSGSPSLHNGS